MQFSNLAKIAGCVVGIYASYKISQLVAEAAMKAHQREKERRNNKPAAVVKLIDDLELYGEHVAKRIAILKGRLRRQEISLDEYNVQLLELVH